MHMHLELWKTYTHILSQPNSIFNDEKKCSLTLTIWMRLKQVCQDSRVSPRCTTHWRHGPFTMLMAGCRSFRPLHFRPLPFRPFSGRPEVHFLNNCYTGVPQLFPYSMVAIAKSTKRNFRVELYRNIKLCQMTKWEEMSILWTIGCSIGR